jgi:hypothetical protein
MPEGIEPRVFISHSRQDKPFVRKLVEQLRQHHLKLWFDEQEIKVGQSIVTRISEGLKDSDYLMVILSRASVASRWVREELNAALMNEISDKGTVVLPVLIENCDIPVLLRSRLYADFRTNFEQGLHSLLAVFEQEEKTAAQVSTGPTQIPAAPCSSSLSNLSLADLRRRMTKRMSRSEVGVIWFDVLGSKMENDMAGRPLVECVIDLLDQARNRNNLPNVIDGICSDRPDLANP